MTQPTPVPVDNFLDDQREAGIVVPVSEYEQLTAVAEAARAYVAYGRRTFGYMPASPWILDETHKLVAAVDALDTPEATDG